MAEQPHWNDWTTLHLVQFTYERRAAPRTVRLTHATARVGDTVRVAVGGAEVEGRINAFEGSVLQVELAAVRAVKPRMAKASARAKGAGQANKRRAG